MSLIEWTNNGASYKLESTDVVHLDHQHWVGLITKLNEFAIAADLRELKLLQLTPSTYSYQLISQDAREFNAVFSFNGAADTAVSFTTDSWKLNLLRDHMVILNALGHLVLNHGLTLFEGTW